MFLSTSDSKFSSQLLSIIISEDSTFAICDDIYITCVSTLMIIDILYMSIEEQGQVNAHK